MISHTQCQAQDKFEIRVGLLTSTTTVGHVNLTTRQQAGTCDTAISFLRILTPHNIIEQELSQEIIKMVERGTCSKSDSLL
jgi:hypothetical protein